LNVERRQHPQRFGLAGLVIAVVVLGLASFGMIAGERTHQIPPMESSARELTELVESFGLLCEVEIRWSTVCSNG
jgi:hypothetical protein